MKFKKLFFSIFFTTLLATGGVFAWTNLGTVNSGETLTAAIWNTMVGKVNENGQKLNGITNVSGNVGINGKISATSFGLDIQYVEANGPTSIQNMSAEVTCPTNYTIIGGGCKTNITWASQLISSHPNYQYNKWLCAGRHEYGIQDANKNITAYAICVKTN